MGKQYILLSSATPPSGGCKWPGTGKLLFHHIWRKTTLVSEEKGNCLIRFGKCHLFFLTFFGWIYQASCNLHFLLKTIIEHPAWAWSLWIFVRSCIRTMPFEAMFTVTGESEMFNCFLPGKNGSLYLHRVFFFALWSGSESYSVMPNSLWSHGLSLEFSRPEYWSG